MGRFAICSEEDGVDACLSALKVNIKLFEEDREAGRSGSAYLLHFAEDSLKKLVLALDKELEQKQTVANKIGEQT